MHVHKQDEVNPQLHSNKLNIWPAAVGNIAILHRQENVQVCGRCCVPVHITIHAVEAQDLQMTEVVPTIVEEAKPVADDSIHHHLEIQLVAKGFELESGLNILG